ncbi:MAG: beta-lactamase family protein [Clostridia bacterium]|nr:beta-lactamase family protein [Clostridia bacterium]
MDKLWNKIDEIRNGKEIPYLDVLCYKEGKELYRYTSQGATGKEVLAMFSMSKPITAVCAMTLVEEGKIGLDDLVEKYLPQVKNAFILKDGKPTPVKNKMTIRNLFTMTAGFSYMTRTPSILELKEKTQDKGNLQDFITAFVSEPLLFEPGERFQYSLCLDVLAGVMEVVENKKFSEIVKERIFVPLKMDESSFDNSITKYAPYHTVNEGKIESGEVNMWPLITPNYESGGAGLVSTVEDYMKFASTLANGGVSDDGVRIISEKALKELSTSQIDKISVENNFTCIQGSDYSYGLGVRVRKTDTEWGLNKGEFGWDGALGSFLLIDPNKKVSIVMGMHLGNWQTIFSDGHLKITEQIYRDFNL